MYLNEKERCITAYTYKDLKIEDIIEWCKKNDQVAWLKEKSNETVAVERHTGRKPKVDENGNICLNKKGHPIYVVDKASPKKTDKAKITFVQLKYEFCKKFMPEILPKKTKEEKKSMYDLIAEL